MFWFFIMIYFVIGVLYVNMDDVLMKTMTPSDRLLSMLTWPMLVYSKYK